jgi:hypothetical protein
MMREFIEDLIGGISLVVIFYSVSIIGHGLGLN